MQKCVVMQGDWMIELEENEFEKKEILKNDAERWALCYDGFRDLAETVWSNKRLACV